MMGTKQRPKKRAKATSPNGTQNIDESNNGPMNTGTLPKNSSAAAAAAARKPSFKRKKADSDMRGVVPSKVLAFRLVARFLSRMWNTP